MKDLLLFTTTYLLGQYYGMYWYSVILFVVGYIAGNLTMQFIRRKRRLEENQ